jgi:hypothetical protein
MALAAFAACVKAFEKTPEGCGLVVARIGERHSYLCLVRGGVESTREYIPTGAADFANEAGCLEFFRDTLRRAGAGHVPILLEGALAGRSETVN